MRTAVASNEPGGSVADKLDAALIGRWVQECLRAMGDYRQQIDALNVFPVPDGDTGTNLFLTWEAARSAVDHAFANGGDGRGSPTKPLPTRAEVAEALSHGSLLGARGNSGVITSQILLGFRQAIDGADGASNDARLMCESLSLGADLAYAAVGQPQEGTILTVIRRAAEGAATALALRASPGESGGVETVVRAALAEAEDALRRTPEQLDVLARAGVVDAGGAGCVVMLEALLAAITGRHREVQAHRWSRRPGSAAHAAVEGSADAEVGLYHGPEYEVMFLLAADTSVIPALRQRLSELGDSLVVVGGDGTWNVHVHVDEIGPAIEAGIAAGRPYRLKVTRLLGPGVARGAADTDRPRDGRALVAVAHGPGVRELLETAGVAVVMADPRHRSSTSELLDAALATCAREVIILPSDSDTRAVADAAADQARGEGIRVAVIPTRAIVQTLAAVAVHDDSVSLEEDLVAMGRAAGATRYGAVTVAVRPADTKAGTCRVGDVLGLVEGQIAEVGDALAGVSLRVLGRLVGTGSELVTVVTGSDATDAMVAEVVEGIRGAHPELDVDVIDGGQPSWPLIFGVE